MPHLRRIARDAGSILVGQLATIGFSVADTIMAGHASSVDLAALSVGAAIYISLYVGLTGIVQALIPLIGHHHGAHAPEQIGETFRQAVYLALMIALPGMVIMWWPDPILAMTAASPEVSAQARGYLSWLAWGLPLALLFRCYSGLNQGISKPLLVTLLQLGALLLKLPLNAWLVFGGAGLPAFGVVGWAMATVIINVMLVSVGTLMLGTHPIYRPFRLWRDWSGPRWAAQKELLRLGLPTGASYFVEVTAFTLMALFISHFGTTALGGHQVIANLASVVYMLPLSIAVATGARVAQLRGASRHAEAAEAGWHGIGLSVSLSVLLGGLLYVVRGPVVAIYSADPDVRAAALQLFIFIAAYQVVDAAQVTTAFALRSMRVALIPALAYAVSLWGLGLAGGYALAFDITGLAPPRLHGASGFWLGNAVALGVVSILLALLYRKVSRAQPDAVAVAEA